MKTHTEECPMGLDCDCGANDGADLETVLAEEDHVAGVEELGEGAATG